MRNACMFMHRLNHAGQHLPPHHASQGLADDTDLASLMSAACKIALKPLRSFVLRLLA